MAFQTLTWNAAMVKALVHKNFIEELSLTIVAHPGS